MLFQLTQSSETVHLKDYSCVPVIAVGIEVSKSHSLSFPWTPPVAPKYFHWTLVTLDQCENHRQRFTVVIALNWWPFQWIVQTVPPTFVPPPIIMFFPSENVKHFTTILLLFTPKSRPTLCDPMDCSAPGFPVFHYLLEFAQTHVYQWCHPTISSSVVPFSSHLQSFQHQSLFTSGGQSTRASSSVLPMNIRGWFPLGWTGLISLFANRFFKTCSCREEEFPVIVQPFCHQSGEPQMKMNVSWLAEEIATRQHLDSWLSVLLLLSCQAHLIVWRSVPPWHGCLMFFFSMW